MESGTLLWQHKGEYYDISTHVEQIQWRGRKGAAARSLSVSLLDDDGYGHSRVGIDVEEGDYCIFSRGGSELFRGIIMSQKQDGSKRLSFTAYDNGIYLANNRDTFHYEKQTASYVFKDICKRYEIPYAQAAEAGHRIPELIKSRTTAWDTILDALSQEYKATGNRFYVQSEKGNLKLLRRKDSILQWVIEPDTNLISYGSTKSIENIRTRVKLVSSKDKVLARKSDFALEAKIGILQEINKPDSELSKGQLQDLATSMLKELSKPEMSLDIESLGITDAISGYGVFVIIPELKLSRTFYIDEDTHTFQDKVHTMRLKLNFANDISGG